MAYVCTCVGVRGYVHWMHEDSDTWYMRYMRYMRYMHNVRQHRCTNGEGIGASAHVSSQAQIHMSMPGVY